MQRLGIAGNGRSFKAGDVMFFCAGGCHQNGTQRVSKGLVVRVTPTRARLERLAPGATGAWRKHSECWHTKKEAANSELSRFLPEIVD